MTGLGGAAFGAVGILIDCPLMSIEIPNERWLRVILGNGLLLQLPLKLFHRMPRISKSIPVAQHDKDLPMKKRLFIKLAGAVGTLAALVAVTGAGHKWG